MTVTAAQASSRQTETARPRLRFGVAFRLLIAFVAITAFAVAVSAVALFTFDKYKNGFARIASSNLPALVAASDLPSVAKPWRRTRQIWRLSMVTSPACLTKSLRNQLVAIAEAGVQIKELAPATPGLESLARSEALLKENLEKLDALAADKLEFDRVATNFMLRLGMLSNRVGAAGTASCHKFPTSHPRALRLTRSPPGPLPPIRRSS